MPKGSIELTNARREEIIKACATLYKKFHFKDVTIKKIGEETSFTRTSIYNYFHTKEEIFLAYLQHEYECWITQLCQIHQSHPSLSRLEFAQALAHSLEERTTLLKLMAMNHYDMEENSRMERLIEFKVVYGRALDEVRHCLKHVSPVLTEQEIEDFIFSFFPFMFGIYPYTVVTNKQREAMDKANVNYVYLSIYELSFREVKKLLSIY